MSYVVRNAGLIKNKYIVEELESIQATLAGITGQKENPDTPEQPPKPEDPDKPKPTAPLGQRWLTGPLLVGLDGAGLPKNYPSYSICTARLTSDTHNLSVNGIDSAIVLVLLSDIDPVTLTGIRAGVQAVRLLALYNQSGATIHLVNQSTSSEAKNRFSWGTTGDAGEVIKIPSGGCVWVMYRPMGTGTSNGRWGLFGIPDVGVENLPPSLTSPEFPVKYWWRGTAVADESMGLGHVYMNGLPAYIAASGASYNSSQLGWGATRTTGAVSGNAEGVAEPAGSGIQTLFGPTTDFLIRTGADISNMRIWCMLVNTATNNSDSLGGAAGSGVGFRYSTVAGDGGWVGVTRDGATQTVSAAVASIAASTNYRLRIRIPEITSAFFSVNGGAEVEVSANLPATNISLRWRVVVVTQTGATRDLTYFRTWQRGRYEPD